MPSVDINPNPKPSMQSGNESFLDGILQVLDKVNSTIDKINNNPMIHQFINKNQNRDTINSSLEAKQYKNQPMPAQPEPEQLSTKKKTEVLDAKQITGFLQTSEGRKQIADGIDELIGLTGDVRLSKLQELLNKTSEGENEND